MPDHPLALELLRTVEIPIAAPSANVSGRPSPTTAGHVRADFGNRLDAIVDGGATSVGLESTVVALEHGHIHILRPGGITREELQEVAPVVEDSTTDGETVKSGARGHAKAVRPPRSPGVRYQHYAPHGEMTLVLGDEEAVTDYILNQVTTGEEHNLRVGILCFSETADAYPEKNTIVLGERFDLTMAAQHLYAALREMDERGVQRIYAEGVPTYGLGQALMNRLTKAAGGRIVQV
jgi:L-threonylcarbamoyladenylate synthase